MLLLLGWPREFGSMVQWDKTTAPVLSRIRRLTLPIVRPEGQPNEHEIECAKEVWAHLGVDMARYKEKDNWSFVEKADRPQVREKLEAVFDKAAFFVGGREARDNFEKADLLAWGDRLRADAAAADAAFAAAYAYFSLNDYAKARGAYERALSINERAWGSESTQVAATLTNLGATYCSLGDYAKARYALERALPIFKREHGSKSKEMAVTLGNLGEVHDNLGDNAKERDVLEAYGRDHPEVAKMLGNLGNAYGQLGDYEKMRDMLEPALAIMKRAYGSGSKEVAKTLNNLGIAYCNLGDHAKARDALECALPFMEREHGNDSTQVAGQMTNLGAAYSELGDYAKARDVLEAALPIVERAYGSESKEVTITLNNLGSVYEKLGEHANQRDTLVHLLPILEQTYGRDHANVDITRKKIVELEKEHGLGHSNVGSALENAANADLMSEDIGTWTCSGSVENVSKRTWKSRSRDGSSRGGDRRSRLPSDRANLDQVDMELDSELLLNEAMSLVSF